MKSKSNKNLKEATSSGLSSGRYTIPMSPGIRIFDKDTLDPYTIPVSKYNDAKLAYDSYDGKLEVSKKTASKIEKRAEKISKFIKDHPSGSDDDGDILNQYPFEKDTPLREQIRKILRETFVKK